MLREFEAEVRVVATLGPIGDEQPVHADAWHVHPRPAIPDRLVSRCSDDDPGFLADLYRPRALVARYSELTTRPSLSRTVHLRVPRS